MSSFLVILREITETRENVMQSMKIIPSTSRLPRVEKPREKPREVDLNASGLTRYT